MIVGWETDSYFRIVCSECGYVALCTPGKEYPLRFKDLEELPVWCPNCGDPKLIDYVKVTDGTTHISHVGTLKL